jgi:hypothetical protein
MRGKSFATALIFLLSAPAVAQSPEIAKPSSADENQIAAIADDFFGRIRDDGVEKAILAQFVQQDGVFTSELLASFRDVDRNCGKLIEVELIDTKDFGSRVARRSFVSVLGSCLIKWDIMFSRRGVVWYFEGFNYETLNGNNWQ